MYSNLRNIKTIWIFFICINSTSIYSQFNIDTAYLSKSIICHKKIHSIVSKPITIGKGLPYEFNCPIEIDSQNYSNLSFLEKAIHAIYFPENCYYNCNYMAYKIKDTQKYIFNSISYQQTNFWSKRQNTFISNFSDSINFILKKELYFKENNEIIYKFIYKKKLVNLLPHLIQNYHLTNNTLNLTLMLLFMKDAKFQPFISSKLYKKFYGNKNTYKIEFTSKLETEILKQTQLFIKLKKLS